jgi:hypothetical protein
MFKKIAVSAVLAILSACGGGGSDGPNPYVLTFKPAIISGNFLEGASNTLAINASLDRAVAGVINVAVIDPVGVIEPTIFLSPSTQLSYNVALYTLAKLPVGNYKGEFEIRLCQDAPTVCNSPLPGSPWKLPYDFNILTRPPSTLAFNPALLSGQGFRGLTQAFSVSAALSPTLVRAATLVVRDNVGVFDLGNTFLYPSATDFRFTLVTKSDLNLGNYKGTLEIQACYDAPACNFPVAGSPWLLPYDFDVIAIPPYKLIFNPAVIVGENFQGVSQSFNVKASLDRSLSPVVTIGVSDKQGVFESFALLGQVNQTDYNLALRTKSGLPAGNYNGVLDVRICFDFSTCTYQVPGSPWTLIYDIKVIPPR